ncbi:MAG: 3-isopropylmalate dehydratase large subunit [Deltaproteobacteria bacterium]|nr:3-isopropylmalate dehydratase large subunit [Deltaproteobacteria bacterium]
MGATLVEKILAAHAGRPTVQPGEVIDLGIDARVARDFGGPNVVRNLRAAGLGIDDPSLTHFTFDTNPGGSDQKYAANQQICRVFAEELGIQVHDIDMGIGTHQAMEEGFIWPGGTLVSTDSHANIMGAIGAFGQGMGDADIAAAFAFGKVWFKVPPTIKVNYIGVPPAGATAKDLVLATAGALGAKGLLGHAAELYGEAVERLDLAGRITVASMATEMGGIIALIPPSDEVVAWCRERSVRPFEPVYADQDAVYAREITIDVGAVTPQIARPGHPEDVVSVASLPATRVDSVFIGSCTNGRMEDLRAAAEVLKGRKVAPGVVLKIVPATDAIWRQAMDEGLFDVFKSAGALIGNAGCGGCAAGQIGQNGPGEVTVSTGNRNFAGKQGQGSVFLASPATAAASAVAGVVVTAEQLTSGQVPVRPVRAPTPRRVVDDADAGAARPEVLEGRVWVVEEDSIDTDMIFHNRHLAETDPAKMGQHAFGNLKGWEDFPQRAQPGDLILTGANFGAGSSRQQAVTCFKSLGVTALIARSFGAIYERNAINEAMPVLSWDWSADQVQDGDRLRVELATGRITNLTRGTEHHARPMSEVEIAIYRRGGLLRRS